VLKSCIIKKIDSINWIHITNHVYNKKQYITDNQIWNNIYFYHIVKRLFKKDPLIKTALQFYYLPSAHILANFPFSRSFKNPTLAIHKFFLGKPSWPSPSWPSVSESSLNRIRYSWWWWIRKLFCLNDVIVVIRERLLLVLGDYSA
jgi:hypothetical protein